MIGWRVRLLKVAIMWQNWQNSKMAYKSFVEEFYQDSEVRRYKTSDFDTSKYFAMYLFRTVFFVCFFLRNSADTFVWIFSPDQIGFPAIGYSYNVWCASDLPSATVAATRRADVLTCGVLAWRAFHCHCSSVPQRSTHRTASRHADPR